MGLSSFIPQWVYFGVVGIDPAAFREVYDTRGSVIVRAGEPEYPSTVTTVDISVFVELQ
jgi:hypothetical protein